MAANQRKPDSRSKKGSKAAVTLLTVAENPDIPPMPPAADWIALPGGDPAKQGGMDADFQSYDLPTEPEWNDAVVRWWESIWSSPMASEFVESDIHGLYLACMYLHESLNPFHKPSDRNTFAKSWEAAVKNYGLTPSARETLRWQVAQGTSAQKRTDQLRTQASNERMKATGSIQDLYGRHG